MIFEEKKQLHYECIVKAFVSICLNYFIFQSIIELQTILLFIYFVA